VAVVGKLLQKKKKLYSRGVTIHKTIQKPGIHKIENKNTKQENKNIKNNVNGVIRK
jgi:hypothetical protein